MRRLTSSLGVLAVVGATVVCHPLSAFADELDDLCGDDPSCTVAPPFGADQGSGIPSGFLALMVLVVMVGIGLAIYRVSVARGMAEKSGMDPGDATRITLLDEDGLSATYLASQMHARAAEPTELPTEPTPPVRSAGDRLRELESLRAQGLITETEHAERRAAVLGEL